MLLKKIKIRELNSAEEIFSAFDLISTMYPEMSFAQYKIHIKEMIKMNNFKMVAVFLEEKMIGVCGYWVLLMLYCDKYFQVSNLVVDQNFRSKGIGKKILNYLEKKAKKLGCKKFVLDSNSENKKSHSLYFREGFYIRGFHFMKNLSND
jgi:GNAT superfamily N-acetyltransferase